MRLDCLFNTALWIANSVIWLYNGNISMALFSLLAVLGSVMLGRLYAD